MIWLLGLPYIFAVHYKEFMKHVAKVARTQYNRAVSEGFVTVPAFMCFLLAGILRLLSVDGQLSEGLILSGSATHRFSHAKAGSELGYHPKVSLERSIKACIDFYLENTTGDH